MSIEEFIRIRDEQIEIAVLSVERFDRTTPTGNLVSVTKTTKTWIPIPTVPDDAPTITVSELVMEKP
jgi:hypothetical protein